LRPANFPRRHAGRVGACIRSATNAHLLVANMMGRLFMMRSTIPFVRPKAIMAQYPLGDRDRDFRRFPRRGDQREDVRSAFRGRAGLGRGRHAHACADRRRIKFCHGGTAYISDAGMCGDYDSSLGMEKEEPLNRFLSKVPRGRFEAAGGPATICGVGVEISDRTGLAEAIAPLRLGPRLTETVPAFWQ
jgi:calcineurin-like phosphoesterase